MRIRQWFVMACGVALVAGATVAVAQAGSSAASGELDGLVEVKSQQFDHVYLRPGADFRGYTKVMLDPTQVSFAKNWLSDMNRHPIAVLQGTTASDAERIAADVGSSLRNVFASAFRNAGYEVVAAPGVDVLGLSLRATDLYINAPKTVTQALPSAVYTYNAGEATLVLEVRNAATGVSLARFVDRRTAGYRGGPRSFRITTTVSNQFDFEGLFAVWAGSCIDQLKAQSPVAMNAREQRSH